MVANVARSSEHEDFLYPSVIPFVLVHLSCVAAIWTGVTWEALGLCVGLYWLRMFAITAGYHRYFSHRAFTTSRVFQFVLAFLAQSTSQKSVLWWAAKHRHHHLHSDMPDDVHSPRHKGFIYSHVGWIFARKHDVADLSKVADLTRFPELVWLHRFEQAPTVVLGLLCLLIGGWSGLIVGFMWSTVLLYHATFCINSLAHVSGSKRYVTGDDSRNNWLLAFFAMGEGWHNNHHAYQSSARQGFRWWEVDLTFYILKMLSWLGIVRRLKAPPVEVLRNEQRLGVKVINRAAEDLAGRFNAERIVLALTVAVRGPDLSAMGEALLRAGGQAAEVLAAWQSPHIPSREEFLAEAKAMFARTPSLDAIVDRAHELLLASIGAQLAARAEVRA